jgi:tetratricopeptide (TPR) repeat protein
MMKAKPPPARRKFASRWDEIEYLYHKLLYWLYEREDARRARRYADRLEQLLRPADPHQEAILGEECRSLVHESRGELRKAIEHREKEIRLIRRLHDVSRDAPFEEAMLGDYGYDDLSDRLDLLAVLYHDSGDLERAIRTLQESKRLCEQHGVTFDGEELLQDYRKQRVDGCGERSMSTVG